MKQLVLASNNAGKLKELSVLLAPLNIEVLPQCAFNVSEADEPYLSFVENALTKARHAARITGLPALADDSGLCVGAMNGAPGVLSARFAGEPRSDERNNALLLERMAGETQRSAYFYCVIVLVRHADDPVPLIACGKWHGEILEAARGQNGFGYDPLFLIPELDQTAAQISNNVKNAISHRALAFRQLFLMLKHEIQLDDCNIDGTYIEGVIKQGDMAGTGEGVRCICSDADLLQYNEFSDIKYTSNKDYNTVNSPHIVKSVIDDFIDNTIRYLK